MTPLRLAVVALKLIRDEEGKVCNGYETCRHVACKSSYTAWTIADKALRAIETFTEE